MSWPTCAGGRGGGSLARAAILSSMLRPSIAALLLVLLASCGGGGDAPQDSAGSGTGSITVSPVIPGLTEYRQARALALAKLEEVRTLAVDTPCSAHEHCAAMELDPTETVCDRPQPRFAYSLVSPTASAASAAAAEYQVLSDAARAIKPPFNGSSTCVSFGGWPARPVCHQQRCVIPQ